METQINKKDLFVLGSGDLGSRVAKLWRAQFPHANIVCETQTSRRHPNLIANGYSTRLRSEPLSQLYPYVLVAIPPSKNQNYEAEVQRGGEIWDGTGSLLMISSTAVFKEDTGNWVEENSALGNSDRALRLIQAENKIQKLGGSILRLAGLYDSEKGPQTVYLRTETSHLNADGWINLIHLDDAASLVEAILRDRHKGIFLGCDDTPIKRQDFVSILSKACSFTGTKKDLGKRCQNHWTRKVTGWEPQWKSFNYWYRSNQTVVLP